LETAAAIAQVSMIGRVMPKLPVISATLATAVSGAWAAAANTPPIATTAYSAAGPTADPKTLWTRVPNAMPAIAPMNSDGANTPPEPPIDRVRLVASTLLTRNRRITPTTTWPLMTEFITG
jgi:hypothetical protein